MSNEYILEATRREVIGKQVKQLRRQGKLPAVVYGHGLESTPLVVDLREATKVLREVGTSTLLKLKVDGNEHAVLVRELQKDIITRQLLHVDFQALAMDETVRTQVALIVLDGEVPAVKDYSAVLTVGLDSLEIECLPKDLPESIEVDASVLKEIGDSITVADLPIPEGITVLTEADTMVLMATAPGGVGEEAEEEELLEEEGVSAEPEVIEKGKGEEEEA